MYLFFFTHLAFSMILFCFPHICSMLIFPTESLLNRIECLSLDCCGNQMVDVFTISPSYQKITGKTINSNSYAMICKWKKAPPTWSKVLQKKFAKFRRTTTNRTLIKPLIEIYKLNGSSNTE